MLQAMKESTEHVLIFTLDNQHYALPLDQVSHVLSASDIKPLPDASPLLKGFFNYHGEVLPVIDMRKRFGLDSRAIDPADHFIIVTKKNERFVLVVDYVSEVIELDTKQMLRKQIQLPDFKSNQTDFGMEYIVFTENKKGIILIYDTDKLINISEEIDINAIKENIDQL